MTFSSHPAQDAGSGAKTGPAAQDRRWFGTDSSQRRDRPDPPSLKAAVKRARKATRCDNARRMSDEPQTRGWLPPRAPGGQAPPRFEPAPPEPESPPASAWQPPAPQPTTEERYWGPPPEPPPPPAASVTHAPSNGLAIAAVVLGIASLVLLLLSLGTSFLFSVPMSGAAWAIGARAKQRDPGPGPARTAAVIGMVGVGLGLASAVVWIILLSAGFSLEDLRDYLERKLEEQRR
jgi:hypothetical protein